jgi:putative addiction module component (TIGR02574 family)
MNKRLDAALTRVRALPDAQQTEIAELLFDVLDQDSLDIQLTPEQKAEIERGLADSEPCVSDAEVQAVFQRPTK